MSDNPSISTTTQKLSLKEYDDLCKARNLITIVISRVAKFLRKHEFPNEDLFDDIQELFNKIFAYWQTYNRLVFDPMYIPESFEGSPNLVQVESDSSSSENDSVISDYESSVTETDYSNSDSELSISYSDSSIEENDLFMN